MLSGATIPIREPPTAAPEILETPEATELPREVITLTISLFLLVDDNEEHDPQISTHRTEAELREILQGMNGIWSQADSGWNWKRSIRWKFRK